MIDTNILLDWLLARDETRTSHIDKLFKREKELQVPDVVMVELAFALEKFYELPRDIVVNNLTTVLDEPVLNCNRALFHRALTDYANHPAWSFLDACLLGQAELQDALPVWTFDKKLISQSAGRAKSPA